MPSIKKATPESPRMLAWPRITGRLASRPKLSSKTRPAVARVRSVTLLKPSRSIPSAVTTATASGAS
jgi:hypothetical protein